jgi:hypothetical protein
MRPGLVWEEAAFDEEGQGGFESQAGGYQGLDPEAVEAFGVIFNLGEEVVEGFELPAALEVFAIEPFAEFFNTGLGLFFARLVAHHWKPSII